MKFQKYIFPGKSFLQLVLINKCSVKYCTSFGTMFLCVEFLLIKCLLLIYIEKSFLDEVIHHSSQKYRNSHQRGSVKKVFL